MRRAWIALALVIAGTSLAQTPKGSVSTEKPPPIEINVSNQDHQYPTKDSPLPVTVLQSSDDAKHVLERERKTDDYQNTYLDTQVRLVGIAHATAWIAFIDIVIGVGALLLLYKTFKETQRTAIAASASANLARQAIAAGRRPRFLVREMVLTEINERSLKIVSVIANAGDAVGTIVSSFADIQSVKPQDWRPLGADQEGNLLHGKKMEAGEQIGWTFEAAIGLGTLISVTHANEIAQMRGQDNPANAPASSLYLRGVIVYEDGFGIKRRTHFLRRLNSWTYRFHTMGPEASDYEYAD